MQKMEFSFFKKLFFWIILSIHGFLSVLSQLHKNENQNFISNFVFQFTKKAEMVLL